MAGLGSREGLVMGVREMDRLLEQWQMDTKDLRRRMIWRQRPGIGSGGTPSCCWHRAGRQQRRRRRWNGNPHTIGRWAAAFSEGGPAALIFEQTGGSPLGETQQAELKAAVQELPEQAGIELSNWYRKVVRQFVSERFGIELSRSSIRV